MFAHIAKLGYLLLIPLAVAAIAIATPILAAVAVGRCCIGCALRWKLRRAWPSGRWILLSYTQSAVWAPYLEGEVIPRLGNACIAIDRTQPNWKARFPVEARAIEHWGGNHENNPLVILFPPWRTVKTVRLFVAFRAKKHGKDGPLASEVARLFSLLARYGRPEH